jgi:hypothetical protein
MRLLLLLAGALLSVSACATLNWSTVQSLQSMKLEDFDPVGARLAILPWVSPFNVEFGVDHLLRDDVTKDEFQIDEDFLMSDITSPKELSALPPVPSREKVRIYGFSTADAERLSAVNKKVTAFLDTPKAQRKGKRGEFSVGVAMFPDEPTYAVLCPHDIRRRYSAWIRVSATQPYRPLVEDKRIAGVARDVLLQTCDNQRPKLSKLQKSG